MPKKKTQETPEEQGARFKTEAEKLVAAGELSLSEADAKMDALIREARAGED